MAGKRGQLNLDFTRQKEQPYFMPRVFGPTKRDIKHDKSKKDQFTNCMLSEMVRQTVPLQEFEHMSLPVIRDPYTKRLAGFIVEDGAGCTYCVPIHELDHSWPKWDRTGCYCDGQGDCVSAPFDIFDISPPGPCSGPGHCKFKCLLSYI